MTTIRCDSCGNECAMNEFVHAQFDLNRPSTLSFRNRNNDSKLYSASIRFDLCAACVERTLLSIYPNITIHSNKSERGDT